MSIPTSVSELNANLLILAMRKLGDTPERLYLTIFPETEALRGDAPPRQYTRGLHDGEARAALNDATNVGEVPVGCVSILGGILAQRRED